jgi:hypothetical protein
MSYCNVKTNLNKRRCKHVTWLRSQIEKEINWLEFFQICKNWSWSRRIKYRNGKGHEELGCIDEDLLGIEQKCVGSKPMEWRNL